MPRLLGAVQAYFWCSLVKLDELLDDSRNNLDDSFKLPVSWLSNGELLDGGNSEHLATIFCNCKIFGGQQVPWCFVTLLNFSSQRFSCDSQVMSWFSAALLQSFHLCSCESTTVRWGFQVVSVTQAMLDDGRIVHQPTLIHDDFPGLVYLAPGGFWRGFNTATGFIQCNIKFTVPHSQVERPS